MKDDSTSGVRRRWNVREALIVGVTGLLYVTLLVLAPRLDVSRDARALLIALGGVADIVVLTLIAVRATRRTR